MRQSRVFILLPIFATSESEALIGRKLQPIRYENPFKQVTEKKERDKTNTNTTQALGKKESRTAPLTAEGRRKADFIKKALMVSNNFQQKITG